MDIKEEKISVNDNDNEYDDENHRSTDDSDDINNVNNRKMKPRVIEKKKHRPRWKWDAGDPVAIRIQNKWMGGFVKRHWLEHYEIDYIAHKMKLKGNDVEDDGILRDIHLIEKVHWTDNENIDDIDNVTLFSPPEFIE